jgi:hypothetical protein
MMQPGAGFYAQFVLSFAGFLCLGIYLCRGQWRNFLRQPLALAVALVALGHASGADSQLALMIYGALTVLAMVFLVLAWRSSNFVPSEVRGGHDGLSLLVGAALFGLAAQLHGVVIGVPVFQLVK